MCKLCVSKWVSERRATGGREDDGKTDGYRTKNQNRTQRCGNFDLWTVNVPNMFAKCPWFSYVSSYQHEFIEDFPWVFLWFSCCLPRFSYDFPVVFPYFPKPLLHISFGDFPCFSDGETHRFPSRPSMISGEKYLGRYGRKRRVSTARKRHLKPWEHMGNPLKILGDYWKTIGFKPWTTIDEMGKYRENYGKPWKIPAKWMF